MISFNPMVFTQAVRAELVVRQAHHDRSFPNVLSKVEGQAQGYRFLAFRQGTEGIIWSPVSIQLWTD